MSSSGDTDSQYFLRPAAVLSPSIEKDYAEDLAKDITSCSRVQSLPLPDAMATEFPSRSLRGVVFDSQIGTPPEEPKAHAQVKDEYAGVDM